MMKRSGWGPGERDGGVYEKGGGRSWVVASLPSGERTGRGRIVGLGFEGMGQRLEIRGRIVGRRATKVPSAQLTGCQPRPGLG